MKMRNLVLSMVVVFVCLFSGVALAEEGLKTLELDENCMATFAPGDDFYKIKSVSCFNRPLFLNSDMDSSVDVIYGNDGDYIERGFKSSSPELRARVEELFAIFDNAIAPGGIFHDRIVYLDTVEMADEFSKEMSLYLENMIQEMAETREKDRKIFSKRLIFLENLPSE